MKLSLVLHFVPIAVLIAGAAGCAAPPERDADSPLIAVSNMLHPPFSSLDAEGRAVGIEVDLVAEAARRLGRDVRWVERPFGELLGAVAEGEADVAAATLGITAERERLVTFSAPYFETEIVALVREGAGEPGSLEELRGRRVGTERGTTAVAAAAERIPGAVRVLERPEGSGWAELLIAGEIDAVVLDRSHAEEFMRAAGARFEVLAEPLRRERFGLAVRHDAVELRAALDEAVAAHLARP